MAAITSGAGTAGQGNSVRTNVVSAGAPSAVAAKRLALLQTADLSTRAGAWRYLRAVGLDPRTVVIQRGDRNYAGAKCPGKRWTCTTATRVLQIGAANTYICSPKTSGAAPNDCVINQVGGGTATCSQTSSANGATQNCSITQTNTTTGANNNAVVLQVLTQEADRGGTQVATQNASIAQSNTMGGSNNVGVTQNVVQLLGRGAAALNDNANDGDDFTPPAKSPIVQKQDAYQRLSVSQLTSTGNNTAGILQTQLQRARADRGPQITQLQNTVDVDGAAKCPVLTAALDDAFANQCNAVQQSSTNGGKNTLTVRQDSRQFQAASRCCTTVGKQAQGSLTDSAHGGLDHRFTQTSSGVSSQNSNQVERQVQRRTDTGAMTAEQHGPTRKGTGTQAGNAGNTATQTQNSVQISTPAASAVLTNIVSDFCSSSGTCSGTQHVDSNGDVEDNSQSGSTIAITVACAEGETCTSTTAPPGSIAVPAGGSAQVQQTYTVPVKPASADIEIAFDTTGSMGPSIANAKAEAAAIVSDVQAAIPDSQFAIVQFRDVGDSPEYAVEQSMTSSASAVQAAIDGLAAGGGGDNPEAYNRVFHESYTPLNGGDIGWRTGTRKFVIVIGDAEPHGAGTDGFSGCTDTSADPTSPTPLSTATELAGMNNAERTLFMIRQASSATTTLQCYQSLAGAAFAGGQGVDGGTTNLAAQIVSLINAATATVDNVHLEVASATPAPAAGSWISFNPASVGPLTSLPANQAFTITVNVPPGTPAGTYTFDIVGIADGADIGHQSVVVFVP